MVESFQLFVVQLDLVNQAYFAAYLGIFCWKEHKIEGNLNVKLASYGNNVLHASQRFMSMTEELDVIVYTKIFLKFPYKFWPGGAEKEFFMYAHERRGYYTFWKMRFERNIKKATEKGQEA